MARHTGLVVGMLFLAHIAAAQFTQQGSKLAGTGAIGTAEQGYSVAISADGNTAIVGGPSDNSAGEQFGYGAAWVFTRSGGVWSQQGSKLVGTGAVGAAWQGLSVAISADGNTAIVGGPSDNPAGGVSGYGAAWVFTRSGGAWTQQGSKLVGTGAVGPAWQGAAVAISADGNTAIVSGPGDNFDTGAVWVWTRSGGVWSRQGSKLVGTGAIGGVQGLSVALSADGNTAIVGGPSDNSNAGAAWVWTRNGSVWTQQGSKLVGTGGFGEDHQGTSVAISADGNTAIVGGPYEYGPVGAAWVFTRSSGIWTQQGSKLVGTGGIGNDTQGSSVALSGDGNTAIVGGPGDSSNVGAAWVFTRSGGAWTQQGNKLVGTGAVGAYVQQGYSVAISSDGNTAIVGGETDNSATGAAWVFVVTCSAVPSITGQPQGQSIESGQAATLSVTASGGTAPLFYQWYQGASGDTSHPVGTNASSFTTPALTANTSYWVRVTNACGHTDSATATVSVTCTLPSITGQPQSQSIPSRQTATLSVTAAGTTPLSCQWYQGASGDTSHPVGTNASSFTTPALTATTSYWVRVSNPCGHTDSVTATVSICLSISAQPQSQTIASGQSATLSVTATGTAPLSYQWYQSTSGNTSHPVGTNASSFTTPALTATTSYWVRVSNSCGQLDSATATVSIISCTPPSITAQPQSQTIASGQSATLSVTATGTAPLYYQWYHGATGDTTQPVGTNASSFTTPALTATTSYWVRVFNACGQADSATATVSISSCASPSITSQPQSQTIAIGQSATLSVTATGATPLYYQWYQGATGDTTQPVGSNASSFTTPALTATTSYWVTVFNACGHADSATATITVAAAHAVRRYLHRQDP